MLRNIYHTRMLILPNVAILLAHQWRHAQADTEVSPRIFRLSSKSSTFSDFYDKVQDDLKSISGMDELLAGKH